MAARRDLKQVTFLLQLYFANIPHDGVVTYIYIVILLTLLN